VREGRGGKGSERKKEREGRGRKGVPDLKVEKMATLELRCRK